MRPTVELGSGRRPFLAVITAETSLLLRTSDDEAISQRLHSVPHGALLLTCPFHSSGAAVSWLTDPVSTDAVVTSHLLGHPLGLAPSRGDASWLAVVARGSSSCFHLHSFCLGGALMFIKESASPVSAVGRFPSAADAYTWLGTAAVEGLHEVLCTTVCAHQAAPVRRPDPAQSARVMLEQERSSGNDRHASSLVTRHASGLSGGTPEGALRMRSAEKGDPLQEAPLKVSLSTSAVWAAQAHETAQGSGCGPNSMQQEKSSPQADPVAVSYYLERGRL